MDYQKFIDLCKSEITKAFNARKGSFYPPIKPEDIYVVWLTKALQNNKALLSTNKSDGLYFEVTNNGDKNEIYIDVYKNQENIKINY